jgi:hypothetical protein
MRRAVFVLACATAIEARAEPRKHGHTPPRPSTPAAQSDPDDARRLEAIAHFERGRERLKERAWDAALAEFARSRQLYAGRGNTQNVAICLRELKRYDEALDAFEALLRDFAATPADVRAIGLEIDRLRPRVGTIEVRITEPNATVVVDGRVRGTTPASVPIRVAAGTHVVRVYKRLFAPFERQVEVAGEQNVPVAGVLAPLSSYGTLVVAEGSGRAAQVVVDGVVVGSTPWEGPLALGPHVLALRDGDAGTAPVEVVVRANAPTTMNLAVAALDADVRIEPVPAGATLALDGVTLGHGLWEGRLPHGPHRIEVAAEGFLPAKSDVTLASDERRIISVVLERDPNSPLWLDPSPPMWVAEIDAALLVTPEVGGHVSNACRGDNLCSRSLPIGEIAMLRAGYQFRSGFTVEGDVGLLRYGLSTKGRHSDFDTVSTPLTGRLDDSVVIQEVALGASVAQHSQGTWPWTVRFGAGVLLGKATDDIAIAAASPAGPLPATATHISGRAAHFWVGPDARFAYRVSRHFEVSAGVHVLMLQVLNQPSADGPYPPGGIPTPAGNPPIVFQQQTFGGKTTLFAGVGIGLRGGI